MPITVSSHGPHVRIVTVDNPSKANAMSRDMLAELADVWKQLDSDPTCRAIVVTGAGDRAFTAGADVSGDLSASEETAATINRALLKTEPFSKPARALEEGSSYSSPPTFGTRRHTQPSDYLRSGGRSTRSAALRRS
jgi:enoyl-CoA hydratase/carnithine racemase